MSDVIVDDHFTHATLFEPNVSWWSHMKTPFWETFFMDKIEQIFEEGGLIVDIGGGLRIDNTRGDREILERKKRLAPLLEKPHIDYRVSDYTDQYNPDFVEDVHNLSFDDNSLDAIICIALLEHVYDPKKAAEEIVRVLKPGGLGFIYAPFIYRYHGHKRDYYDYFRYSKDGWSYLFRSCESIELCPVRGLFETLLRFTPLHTITPLNLFCRTVDVSCKKMRSISDKQTSGYHVFIRK